MFAGSPEYIRAVAMERERHIEETLFAARRAEDARAARPGERRFVPKPVRSVLRVPRFRSRLAQSRPVP